MKIPSPAQSPWRAVAAVVLVGATLWILWAWLGTRAWAAGPLPDPGWGEVPVGTRAGDLSGYGPGFGPVPSQGPAPPSPSLPSGSPPALAPPSEAPGASTPGPAAPAGTGPGAMDVPGVDTRSVEQFWRDIVEKYGGYLPPDSIPSVVGFVENGSGSWAVLKGLARFVLDEWGKSLGLLGMLILLAIFAAVLETLQGSFSHPEVSRIAFAGVYLALLVLAVQSFFGAVGAARGAVQMMIDCMLAVLPLLTALLAAVGAFSTAAMLHPLTIGITHVVSYVTTTVVIPLIFFSAVLDITSLLSERYRATQLAGVLRTAAITVLGLCLTVFLGVIAISGGTRAVADGVAIRVAKFATASFVPVVGKMFSDATETVVGASLLLKNVVGVAGAVVMLMICAFPALKILTVAMVYNITGALVQPLGTSMLAQSLGAIGKTLMILFAAVATVGMMFFLGITAVITVGNLSVMAR
ncbi:stage III sporulation protein AE [Kyrpidia sp.]|uniref:stage III sporulation protein AE n=1 Tax=Kyrpidia sp. TaxID=2073077 RepID=UPI002588982B|nr:stage III sporulation protein AE [Kyrpidia sp.]MCL6576022.1 stage III sporulation protein AE [Kyrpidia sp.]